jgi:hypothetical protein
VTTGLKILRAPIAEGLASPLSDADEHSLKIQVDSVPEGFKVVHLKHGINFYCSSCDCPVEL